MKLFTALCLIVFSFSDAKATTLVVSDIDDTIKYIDIVNPANTIYNGLFKMTSFSGMAQLYQALEKKDTTIFYVSGSPPLIRKKLDHFLAMHGFPQKENIILKSGSRTSTYDYKVSAISGIIKKLNPEKIILIGDDTKSDPQVYETIHNQNPSKVEAIYIRSVRNLAMPPLPNIKTYVSAVEIAGFEMLRGTVTGKDFLEVADKFNRCTKRTKIFIKKRHCPLEGSANIEELKQKVREQNQIDALIKTQKKIIAACEN